MGNASTASKIEAVSGRCPIFCWKGGTCNWTIYSGLHKDDQSL